MTEDQKKNYTIFLKWYAMPESVRDPKSIPEFCAFMGLTEKDIAEYREQEDFTDLLMNYSLEWGKTKIPELLGIIYDSARTNKNISHIKSFADLVNSSDKKKIEELKEANKTKQKESSSLRDLFAE
jgi:hypothetical protein